MTLMALKKLPIPGTSVYMSLQSLSISVLVLFLGKRAFGVVLFYLCLATLAFPVFPEGTVNSQWYISPPAGYYFGFLLSSFYLPRILLSTKPQNFFSAWLCLSLNETLILFCGYVVLSFYLGPLQAWWVAIWPYLFGASLKITTASCIYLLKLRFSSSFDLLSEKQTLEIG
ncbi:biotin transporter BioY [Legionella brunensis]|nr:biotin transporter BioY [Legionella brunensis]